MNVSKLASEKYVFYGVLIINILIISTIKFYPSMDGASHLYNSNIICHLLKGDSSVINNFFTLNKVIIPNWTSYIILSLFNLFLPAWVAEKILIVLYLIGLSISFRLLVKQLNPRNTNLSIMIMPFAYSFIFHLGFYNYSLSFIFLFLTLYFWLKNFENPQFQNYVILFVLLLFTYLSAIITFFFLGFCLGLIIVIFSITDYYNKKNYLFIVKKIAKELTFLFITALPILLFSAIFIKSTIFFSTNEQISTGELIKWLHDVRCIIVYDYVGEQRLTKHFSHIVIAIFSISFFIRFFNRENVRFTNFFQKSDIIIIPTLLALLFFFIIPNGSNAGMMSDRFCLLIYMFLIIWVSSQSLPNWISIVFILVIIIFHFELLFKHQNGSIRNLNNDAVIIYKSSKYIKNNSIVLPINMSNNWLEPHFSNYLGVDNSLVILENYEASVGWFPVKWNIEKLPHLKLGELDAVKGIKWISNTQSNQIKQIDYVFLYGNPNLINERNWDELKNALKKYYILIFTSENNYVAIYKRI